MFKVPFVEQISGIQVLKEIKIDVNKQSAITKDNVTVHLDGILYIKVETRLPSNFADFTCRFLILTNQTTVLWTLNRR